MASEDDKPVIPRPSSSVLLISPTNQVLLLHRVETSTSFASAHVFPGGNVSEYHDGRVPEPSQPGRHEDGLAYRNAAIRETFEESGILLARNNGFGRLIEVPESEREEGRRKVHSNEVPFSKWLAGKGGRADVDGLIPFTRWITPAYLPKRYTTQMYLYFLPLAKETNESSDSAGVGSPQSHSETMISTPKHDGGIEHTSAKFLPASEWLELSKAGKIVLFPPQYFLLYQIAQFLDSSGSVQPLSSATLGQQRKSLMDFVKRPAGAGGPTWGEAVIGPGAVIPRTKDGKTILGLDKPGLELEGTDRRGIKEWVISVKFGKGAPRQVDVMLRKEAFDKERNDKDAQAKL